ncbi:MAG: universal stress protein [Halorientalis sp.]
MNYLIATDSPDTSETLCAAVRPHLDATDTVFAVNSLHGGDRTPDETVQTGTAALERVEAELGERVSVDTHQLIRKNDPATDLFDFADEHGVDRLVIGVRKRNPTGKVVFGSTAQDVILNTDRPVLAVPRT